MRVPARGRVAELLKMWAAGRSATTQNSTPSDGYRGPYPITAMTMRGTRYKLVLAPPACEQVMVARLLRRHLARLIFDATFRGKKHKE